MPDPLTIGANLVLEATAAEVAANLGAQGIEVVLLRGPALTEWLYGDAGERTSLDVDLLVDPERIRDAEAVMGQLGFRRSVGLTPGTEPEHAESWRRPAGATVDLHWTLVGARSNPSRVWEIILSRTQPRRIADLEIMVPSAALRPLLVALHAGQHGRDFGRTLHDLERALTIVSDEDWSIAGNLAGEIDAVELFAAGLRLSPTGSRVAKTLGLPKQTSVATALLAATPVPTSTGYEWLAKTPGFSSRVRLLWFKLIPPAAFMRDWHPLARRGRIGLALAYLYRPLWLAWWAPRGYLAWRRAKRASERSRTE